MSKIEISDIEELLGLLSDSNEAIVKRTALVLEQLHRLNLNEEKTEEIKKTLKEMAADSRQFQGWYRIKKS